MLNGRISNKADLPALTMHLQSLVNQLLQEHASQQLVADPVGFMTRGVVSHRARTRP
jgi:hypothetical protein